VLARLRTNLVFEGSQGVNCRLDVASADRRLGSGELAGQRVGNAAVVDAPGGENVSDQVADAGCWMQWL
jgi:hypothetical protein